MFLMIISVGFLLSSSFLAPTQALMLKNELAPDGDGSGGPGRPELPADQITDDGAWSWFTDPRAVRVGEYTYVGWISHYPGDVVVAQYHHQTREVKSTILHSALQPDDHDNPAILVLPDRRLRVFYSRHVGNEMFYRESFVPDSIEQWGPEQVLPTGQESSYTYPNPVYLSDEGKTYLFWRGFNYLPVFSSSVDGSTWQPWRYLITTTARNPYVRYASNGRDSIYLAFTDSHPEAVTNNSIYFALYRNGNFYRADGSFIKSEADLPLRVEEIDRVYDSITTGRKAWIWDVAFDASGRPIIVFASFVSTTDHRYQYARWTGSAWEQHEMTAAGRSIDETREDPYYSGGIILDHEDPSVAYLSRQVNGQFEIERWFTPDGGLHWVSQPLTTGSSDKNVRPFVPYGHRPGDCSVVWMQGLYLGYTFFSTALKCNQGNQPPLTWAGSDSVVMSPQDTRWLKGAVYDDGVSAPVRTLWTQVEGPAPAEIVDPLSLTTAVRLPVEGAYRLRLHAFDGALMSSSDVTLQRLGPSVSVLRSVAATTTAGTYGTTVTLVTAGKF